MLVLIIPILWFLSLWMWGKTEKAELSALSARNPIFETAALDKPFKNKILYKYGHWPSQILTYGPALALFCLPFVIGVFHVLTWVPFWFFGAPVLSMFVLAVIGNIKDNRRWHNGLLVVWGITIVLAVPCLVVLVFLTETPQ